MTVHKLSSATGAGTALQVTPEIAGWDFLDFAVKNLDAGQQSTIETADREVAVVPLEGTFAARIDGEACPTTSTCSGAEARSDAAASSPGKITGVAQLSNVGCEKSRPRPLVRTTTAGGRSLPRCWARQA